MASTSEIGHAKMVANLKTMIAFVTGYGGSYAPTRASITLPALTALKTNAEAAITDVLNKKTSYGTAVNDRVAAFADLAPLATRIVNYLQATDASDALIDDARGYNAKIQGYRLTPLPTPSPDPTIPEPTTISVSQRSYTQLIQHFSGLIAVIETEPSYTPAETALQLVTLKAYRDELIAKNDAIDTVIASLSNARIARDKILYHDADSIFETAADVKNYVQAVYGTNSPEYAQIKGLTFKRP